MCLIETCDGVIHSFIQHIALRYLATSFGPECGPSNVRLQSKVLCGTVNINLLAPEFGI